jgi:hypothetical protein
LNSHSFLWQHFHFPLEIVVAFAKAKGLKAKWRVVFGKPDAIDPRYKAILERKLLNVAPHPVRPNPSLKHYIISQTVLSLFLLFITALFEHHLQVKYLWLLSLFIIISLINTGAMLDQRSWIFYLEAARAALVLIYIGVLFQHPALVILLATLFISLVYKFETIQQRYLKLLYDKG